MTKIIYLLIGIFLLQSCEKKELSESEILDIIHSQEGYENLHLKADFLTGNTLVDSTNKIKKVLNDENFKSIYEADFNNDGKIDYLVNLSYKKSLDSNDVIKNYIAKDNYQTIVLLSRDKGYTFLNPGKGNIYQIVAAKIIQYKNQPFIKMIRYHTDFDSSTEIFDVDTLMIKNNELMEYYSKIKKHKIKKIIFTQNKLFSTKKIYRLTLTEDSLLLNSDHYKNLRGNFSGEGYAGFQKLANDLNEVNFSKINDRYPFWSDDFFVATEITFDNGKSKEIYDYNGKRYLWLINFYEKIDTLMAKQKWVEIEYPSAKKNR
ncbi:DUF6438 domain-containing protein [Chryseobacterium gwangjuense]|uniref:DUF6438 domain-containing protein n=1 Tax=Chryseobacterium gwangjuense TaxID=1069980 RepID=UPI001E51D4C7|nr:hypothetical protein [Chryseobacterium gwangjuense]MCE3076141.1 hypothetical protein [Chryseobacterium gwangjuense]